MRLNEDEVIDYDWLSCTQSKYECNVCKRITLLVKHVTLTRSHDAITWMVELCIVSGSGAVDNSLLPTFLLAAHVLALSHF